LTAATVELYEVICHEHPPGRSTSNLRAIIARTGRDWNRLIDTAKHALVHLKLPVRGRKHGAPAGVLLPSAAGVS